MLLFIKLAWLWYLADWTIGQGLNNLQKAKWIKFFSCYKFSIHAKKARVSTVNELKIKLINLSERTGGGRKKGYRYQWITCPFKLGCNWDWIIPTRFCIKIDIHLPALISFFKLKSEIEPFELEHNNSTSLH